jgi:phosphate transport system substrate-binding protein
MMPRLLPRPHLRGPRRAPAAAAVICLAALTACTSTATSTQPPAAVDTTVAQLAGAGSTFAAPFFTSAFGAYRQAHPGVAVNYAAVGSSAGIARFAAGRADFGATDVPASAADLGAASATTVQVPAVLGAVSVAYNVLTRNGAPLKLTGPVLAEIFLGQVTKWNDPAVTALNPGADLPDAHITVVHRADGSGTTYIFSDYLSAVSPGWAARVGKGRSLHWPTGYAATGNPGVANAISRIAYSIGYAERSYTTGTSLGVAAIRNRAGNYVTPATAAITANAAGKPSVTPVSFSIVNQAGPDAYPICGYSWILLSARQHSASDGHALVGLVSWLTHDGQSHAAALGYGPLPSAVQQYAATALAHITGPDGTPLTS